jgi:hypothetical protein
MTPLSPRGPTDERPLRQSQTPETLPIGKQLLAHELAPDRANLCRFVRMLNIYFKKVFD